MQTVKNISKERQAVTGIPAFEAGEERVVDEETASVLTANTNFVLVAEKVVQEKPVKASKSK